MADEIKTEKETQEMVELTAEEKAEAWSQYVRSDVIALLDTFLPKAIKSNIGLKYKPLVVEVLETGEVLDETKATGAVLMVDFTFETPIDRTKPIE